MIKWLLIFGLLPTIALAQDKHQYRNIDPKIKAWIHSLKDGKGFGCCDTSDGFPAEAIYDTETDHYKVLIEGVWYPITDTQLLKEPNLLGYAMVWYVKVGGVVQIRCFIPGAGG